MFWRFPYERKKEKKEKNDEGIRNFSYLCTPNNIIGIKE